MMDIETAIEVLEDCLESINSGYYSDFMGHKHGAEVLKMAIAALQEQKRNINSKGEE